MELSIDQISVEKNQKYDKVLEEIKTTRNKNKELCFLNQNKNEIINEQPSLNESDAISDILRTHSNIVNKMNKNNGKISEVFVFWVEKLNKLAQSLTNIKSK